MAVYFKFKSARDYDSIPIDGHFISVGNLKERIFESKHLGRGTDFDLMISNAQTDEEYADDATLIPKNTSVLVRRIPGRLRKPIVTQTNEHEGVNDKVEVQQHGIAPVADASSTKFIEESEWDEFGTDLYAIPEVVHAPSNSLTSILPPNNVEEESKIKALIDTPALDWERQMQEHFGPGRGYGRGLGGRMMAGRGFGRGGLDRKTPPPGYICHRCKIPGHFIQHCPTNGDPNYDIKRVKPPTGIPKSMLMATPDGSYALPSGAVAVLKPNEAAFEKEIEGLPSTRPVSDLPPELRCPLCKEVMKDAVLTSKCCFSSFCDKCIRDYIISKSMCVCGFTNILADDLLPNKTLRETINRIMEASATSSAENAGSLAQVQDMESSRPLPQKLPSPTVSATEETAKLLPSPVRPVDIKDDTPKNNGKEEVMASQPSQCKVTKRADISEGTQESLSLKEPASLESAPVPEEVQEKLLSSEQVKKKKKRKMRPPGNAADMQWRSFQDMNVDNYAAMSMPPSAYNSYFPGMGWGMDGYMPSFPNHMPLMTYPQNPFDVPFVGAFPQDPFAGQSYIMPPLFPQRDLSEITMGVNKNPGASAKAREEVDARKTNLRVKREPERHIDREQQPKDRGKIRDISSAEAALKPRPKLMSEAAVVDRRAPKSPARPSSSTRDLAKRPSPSLPSQHLRSNKRKVDDDADTSVVEPKPSDKKQKASVFSRISFPDSSKDGMKRKKSSEPPNGLKETHEAPTRVSREERKPARSSLLSGSGRNSYDHESSEEEHHFKRRPSSSRHEEALQRDEDTWNSRTSRDQSHMRK